ncbi:MAG: STAS domain-containing protein [Chloroflexota bacterium]
MDVIKIANMELQVVRHNVNSLILTIIGRLDAQTVDQLKGIWGNDESVHSIVLNLAQTVFIDSLGLATLVNGLKTMRAREGSFILAAPSDAVLTIFELTAMDKAFNITQSVESAVALL